MLLGVTNNNTIPPRKHEHYINNVSIYMHTNHYWKNNGREKYENFQLL